MPSHSREKNIKRNKKNRSARLEWTTLVTTTYLSQPRCPQTTILLPRREAQHPARRRPAVPAVEQSYIDTAASSWENGRDTGWYCVRLWRWARHLGPAKCHCAPMTQPPAAMYT